MFDILGHKVKLGPSDNVSRTNHPFDRDSAKAALPCPHHVVDEIIWQNTLVLRLVFDSSDFSVGFIFCKFSIRYSVVNRDAHLYRHRSQRHQLSIH